MSIKENSGFANSRRAHDSMDTGTMYDVLDAPNECAAPQRASHDVRRARTKRHSHLLLELM
jgi:hypothetical protein